MKNKLIPPEALPPRYYRIDDRLLGPSFFGGTKPVGPIEVGGTFKRERILDKDAPPAGTVMQFAWHTFAGERYARATIVVLEDLQAWEASQQQRDAVAAADYEWRLMVLDAEKDNANRDSNAALSIPVRWQPAFKSVLNGCGAGYGSGARSNNVDHVHLLEPLRAGRLKRAAGDLLCGGDRGSMGLIEPTSTTPIYPVTCSACLRIAERFCCKETING